MVRKRYKMCNGTRFPYRGFGWIVSHVKRGYIVTLPSVDTATLSEVSNRESFLSVDLEANTMYPDCHLMSMFAWHDDVITVHANKPGDTLDISVRGV
jgi:hypothetical protein